jgi:hypothetical protein
MTEFHNPTWLVERAWSSLRLPALQRVIELTISDLKRIDPVPIERCGDASLDARGEALKACCAELRHASAMIDAEADRATHCEHVRLHIAKQRDNWGEDFSLALVEYRRAASVALQASFAKSPEAAASASQH